MAKKDKAPKLSKQKKAFAEAYMDMFLDVSEAATACGIKVAKGRKWIKEVDVRKYYLYHLHNLRLDPVEFVKHMELIAFGDVADLYETVKIKDPKTGKTIRKVERLKRVRDMPVHMRRRIKRLKYTLNKYGMLDTQFELVSREKAIEILAKFLLITADINEGPGKHGVLLMPVIDPADWAKLAKAQQKKTAKPGTQQ